MVTSTLGAGHESTPQLSALTTISCGGALIAPERNKWLWKNA
jgi:hypothetical protein